MDLDADILEQWIEKVRCAIPLCPARFTLHDVCKALNVNTEQSKARVSVALAHLATPHTVVRVSRGGGRKPAVYEHILLSSVLNDAA